ncbi:MAG: hypothetical protein WKF96_00075 [Solirubrobacteraceae bacterium]
MSAPAKPAAANTDDRAARRRATRAAAKEKAKLEQASPGADAGDASPVEGVFVVRVLHPDGGFSTQVIPQGDVRLSEVESILKKGLKGWRGQAGLQE